MIGDARVPADWQVLDGDGGPGDEVVREFTLFDGGGRMTSPKDGEPGAVPSPPHEPVPWHAYQDFFNRMSATHESEIARLNTAHDKEMARVIGEHEKTIETLMGNRWTAEASLHAVIDPDGQHRFVSDRTFDIDITISNPSPHEWEVVDASLDGMRWKDRAAPGARWSKLTGQPSVVITSIPASTASTAPVHVHLSFETSRVFHGGLDLAVDPVGLELIVRRYNTTAKQNLDVHLIGGLLTIRPARSP